MGTTSFVIAFYFLDLPILPKALVVLPVVSVVLTEKIFSHSGQFFLAIAARGVSLASPLLSVVSSEIISDIFLGLGLVLHLPQKVDFGFLEEAHHFASVVAISLVGVIESGQKSGEELSFEHQFPVTFNFPPDNLFLRILLEEVKQLLDSSRPIDNFGEEALDQFFVAVEVDGAVGVIKDGELYLEGREILAETIEGQKVNSVEEEGGGLNEVGVEVVGWELPLFDVEEVGVDAVVLEELQDPPAQDVVLLLFRALHGLLDVFVVVVEARVDFPFKARVVGQSSHSLLFLRWHRYQVIIPIQSQLLFIAPAPRSYLPYFNSPQGVGGTLGRPFDNKIIYQYLININYADIRQDPHRQDHHSGRRAI